MELLAQQFLCVDTDRNAGYGRGYSLFDTGSGNAEGFGSGFGRGSGCGRDYDKCEGFGEGYNFRHVGGHGNGNGKGVAEIEGYKVYEVEDVNIVITDIRGNVAQGFELFENTNFIPCFIVKENGRFGHGKTLFEARADLKEKLFTYFNATEYIVAFIEKFPEYDTRYSVADLLLYHNAWTEGSCRRMGFEYFCKKYGLNFDGTITVCEFIGIVGDDSCYVGRCYEVISKMLQMRKYKHERTD
jgi:hypothetical protein